MINAGLQTCAASEEECRSSKGRVCVQGNCQIEIDPAVQLFNLGTYFFSDFMCFAKKSLKSRVILRNLVVREKTRVRR